MAERTDNRPHAAQNAAKGMRATLVGMLLNVLLVLTKGVAGVAGHSYALIADAIESAMDIMKSLVVLSGLKIAAAPPDENHPYGHGKAEPLAAIVVALSLLVGAVGLAIQCAREIRLPEQDAPAAFTLIVLVGVVITKEIMFRFLDSVGEEVHSSAIKTDAWHHRSDAITSVAAFIGITIALVGGKGYEVADDWAALFACAIIAYNGYRLLVPAIGEVMDAAPPPEIEAGIRQTAANVEGVEALEYCWVRKMGFDYYVDLHLHVDGDISVREGHHVAHRVKSAIMAADPKIRGVLIHVEPKD